MVSVTCSNDRDDSNDEFEDADYGDKLNRMID